MKVLFKLCFVIFIVSLCCYPIQSEDLFMYLALAKHFFATGSFPAQDIFLYTLKDYSWTIMHQWLGYLVYYGLYIAGGFNLIILTKTALISFFLLLPILSRRLSQVSLFYWGASVFLAMSAMSFRLMERTSLFSDFLILAVLWILLTENKKPGKLKYLLPVLFLFWVNLHPVFPIGWALCGLFLVCRMRRFREKEYQRFAIITFFSVIICLINPQGLTGLLYPLQFATNEGVVFRKYYFEWMPTLGSLFINQAQTVFLGLLIALNVFLIFRTRRSKPVFEALASVFFIAYGLYAIRFVPTLCFTLTYLNFSLAKRLPEIHFVKKMNYAMAALALLLGVKNIAYGYNVISGHREFGLGLDPAVVPAKAAEIILNNKQIGNVFNSHMFGSYLAWAWGGQRKIFYHGFVTDTNLFLNEYVAFSENADRFNQQVEKYHIDAFLLDRFRGNEALLNILVAHPHWQLAYKDEGTLIFIRK